MAWFKEKKPEKDRTKFINEVERYARYLELKLQFFNYEAMTDEEREVFTVRKKRQDKDASFHMATNNDTGESYPINLEPVCSFGCKNPMMCNCKKMWEHYLKLKDIYKPFGAHPPHIYDTNTTGQWSMIYPDLKWILEKLDFHPNYGRESKFLLPARTECKECRHIYSLTNNTVCPKCLEKSATSLRDSYLVSRT